MKDDAELLRLYAHDRSEPAFSELVRRHVNFVYSAALRQVNGDAHLAGDVTQIVFTDLARKAKSLAGHQVLAGWLFTSTRFAASRLIRTEQRRRIREQEAEVMHENEPLETDSAAWERISPVLDEALGQLNTVDRDAVLLRYFEGRGFSEIGRHLRVSENAARMRVDRALEKLRDQLARRGLTSTTATLGAALGTYGVIGAPTSLSAVVTGAALASGGAAATTVFTFMSMSKLPAATAAALTLIGGAGYFLQADTQAQLREELARLHAAQRSPEAGANTVDKADGALAAELADLRRDDAEFARLAAEAEALRARFATTTRAVSVNSTQSPAGPALDVRELDALPSPRVQARPVYPFGMRRAGLSGEVLVDFVVDREGIVRGATARSSKIIVNGAEIRISDPAVASGGVVLQTFDVHSPQAAGDAAPASAETVNEAMFGELEKAAIEAVGKWRFRAGLKGGAAVNTRLTVPIVFSVQPPNADAAANAKKRSDEMRWF